MDAKEGDDSEQLLADASTDAGADVTSPEPDNDTATNTAPLCNSIDCGDYGFCEEDNGEASPLSSSQKP